MEKTCLPFRLSSSPTFVSSFMASHANAAGPARSTAQPRSGSRQQRLHRTLEVLKRDVDDVAVSSASVRDPARGRDVDLGVRELEVDIHQGSQLVITLD